MSKKQDFERKVRLFCSKWGIKNYSIRNIIDSYGHITQVVDVDGKVGLYSRDLTELPFQFGHVNGTFDCGYNYLTSLKGAPTVVKGDFECGHNKLTSLEYAPKKVGGTFDCQANPLESLKHLPLVINGNLNFVNCQFIKDLSPISENVRGIIWCYGADLYNHSFDVLFEKGVNLDKIGVNKEIFNLKLLYRRWSLAQIIKD